jgi:2-polyprenyl-3-methyl-5-hydroxy-6-metoxy-1,4-benzoquinol methylase
MAACNSKIDCENDRSLVFKKNGYLIWDCKECDYRFAQIDDKTTHVSKVYSDDYFFNGRDGYPNYLDEKDILYNHGLYYSSLIKKYLQPGQILDVGCAAGFILKAFQEAGWNCKGIEPNKTMASYAQNNLNLDVKTESLEELDFQEQFDLIILIQVIGHVYDLDKSIENLASSLKPGGLILIESWNMDSLIARIMGKNWHEYSPPSVINWFSTKTLTNFLRHHNFERIAMGHPVKK